MTLRTDMINSLTAGLAQLPDRQPAIQRAILKHTHPNGAFTGRSPDSDLYYTMFAAEILHTCKEPTFQPKLISWLSPNQPNYTNLVEFASLIRLYANFLPNQLNPQTPNFRDQLQQLFTPNIYSCFLTLGICQDLKIPVPNIDTISQCIQTLRLPDGSYINSPKIPLGAAPVTAAALLTKYHLTKTIDTQTAQWLKEQFLSTGGCKTVSLAPKPDLLATAVALHALKVTQTNLTDIAPTTRAFVLALQNPEGTFNPQTGLNETDPEYTYYGLMALGDLQP